MKRYAIAKWQGSGKEGNGLLTTESSILNNSPYNYLSRFEDGKNTNPEELIAAAHAGCFNMKLSFVIGNFGFVPENLETKCLINMVDGKITGSELILTASVPGIDANLFDKCVNEAKDECPISALFNVPISMSYSLES